MTPFPAASPLAFTTSAGKLALETPKSSEDGLLMLSIKAFKLKEISTSLVH